MGRITQLVFGVTAGGVVGTLSLIRGYALRRDSRRARWFRMTRANARRASFASRGPGNTAATAGSRVTVRLPFAYREAYLLRRARLKSYSGRTSSARRRRPATVLAFTFFMNSPLAARRLARTDQPDRIAALREHYHGSRFLERDPMLSDVLPRLTTIPFKAQVAQFHLTLSFARKQSARNAQRVRRIFQAAVRQAAEPALRTRRRPRRRRWPASCPGRECRRRSTMSCSGRTTTDSR
jgi:hypothetical protein